MGLSIFRKLSVDNRGFHPEPARARQPKLEINSPGDRFEREADAMAAHVTGMPSEGLAPGDAMAGTAGPATAPVTQGGMIGRSIQRKCAHCEEDEKKKKSLMRKSDGVGAKGTFSSGNGGSDGSGLQASSTLASSLNHAAGKGSPLPQNTRGFMENAFSADFSSVRVHTDNQASEMSRSVRARAFTYGNDIYFRRGTYDPSSQRGKSLLAHELTHVVQQATGLRKTAAVQRQGDDTAQPMDAARCYTCQIPGGLGICCPSTNMPLVPECWDLATSIIDNCPGPRESCLREAKCAQCQCVAAKRGEQYCSCTGMV